MQTVAPYRPRPRRDARIERLFWQGIYYGIVVGLLAGAAAWGLLMLGGAAPALATDRVRSLLTLVGCGVYSLLAVTSWVWGWFAAPLMDDDALDVTGPWVQSLVRLFARARASSSEDSEEVDEEDVPDDDPRDIASRLARGLIAGLIGPPLMLSFALARAIRPLTVAPLRVMAVSGLAAWVLVTAAGWRWLMAMPPRPDSAAIQQAHEQAARAERWDAEYNSNLQLAVARAKRARDAGHDQRAIEILETALREAEAHGRSVAHLQLHWMLGWLYAKAGNTDGAMVMFQTVLQLAEPGSVEATEATAALQRLSKRAATLPPPELPASPSQPAPSQGSAPGSGAPSATGSEVRNGPNR